MNGIVKRDAAVALLRKLPEQATFVPVQVLGELFNVLVRKAGKPKPAARDAILGWKNAFLVIDTSPEMLVRAIDLSIDHDLSIWDAVILAAAVGVECRILISENLQDGFTWGGCTVVNPFATPRNVLLQSFFVD